MGWAYGGDKFCPCCRSLGTEVEEDEYHAFCGDCPRTRNLYTDFVTDINGVLRECGVRKDLDEIYGGVSHDERSKHIFRVLLADTAGGRFPDRNGSWSIAKARFEEYCLRCWTARAAMIKDPEGYQKACEEMLSELDIIEEEDSAGELERSLTEIVEGNNGIFREHIASRQLQEAAVMRNVRAKKKKTKPSAKKKKKAKPTQQENFSLRLVRRLDDDKMGYIVKKSGSNYEIQLPPWTGPTVELQESEIKIENDWLGQPPSLHLIGTEISLPDGVRATVKGFDPECDEFTVQFTREVAQFWDFKYNNKSNIWKIREQRLEQIILERAQAGGTPDPLAYPGEG